MKTTSSPLSPKMPRLLLAWYDAAARDLPWRREPTPYHVWVSEIMLQQTRVEAGRGYYLRFIEALPDFAALAAAPEDALMKLWEGLGYYSRARNMKRAAQLICREYGGEMPADYDAVRALPGVGEYTAGAVCSIAFGMPVPAVDGNVLRVLSRLTASREDIAAPATKKRFGQLLSAVIPKDRAGDFNQSLMELGALICTPRSPRCGACPLAALCAASALGLAEKLPVKKPRAARRVERRTVFVLTAGGRVALRRRPERGLLAGLWEFPCAEEALADADAAAWLAARGIPGARLQPLGAARHVFTHREWEMLGYRARLADCPPTEDWEWVPLGELAAHVALPSAFRAYTGALAEE